MNKATKATRKFAITIIGFLVLITGLILIPIPGPGGIPVTLLGLFILSKEFAWAERHLNNAKSAHKEMMEKTRAKQEELKKKREA